MLETPEIDMVDCLNFISFFLALFWKCTLGTCKEASKDPNIYSNHSVK